MLVVVLLVMYFAGREPSMTGSTALVLAAFILVSLAEVAVMPWYFLDQASHRLDPPLTDEQARDFANFYAIALLGGTTPCVLGLVYFVISDDLLPSLLLYAIGVAGMLFYGLRIDAIVARHMLEAPEAPGAPAPGQ